MESLHWHCHCRWRTGEGLQIKIWWGTGLNELWVNGSNTPYSTAPLGALGLLVEVDMFSAMRLKDTDPNMTMVWNSVGLHR